MPQLRRAVPDIFVHQTEEAGTQAAPVQNTYYTILDAVMNCKLISVNVSVADTGETLQLRVTVDGNAYVSAAVAVGADADFMAEHAPVITALQKFTLTAVAVTNIPFLEEGRTVKVELRKTTAAGAGTLSWRVRYAKIP